jgi:hypothetical protein
MSTKGPTKAEKNQLIKLFAIYVSAAKGADIRVQQKTYDRYSKYFNKLENKYPDIYFRSEETMRQLERAAEKYNDIIGSRGPGRDW